MYFGLFKCTHVERQTQTPHYSLLMLCICFSCILPHTHLLVVYGEQFSTAARSPTRYAQRSFLLPARSVIYIQFLCDCIIYMDKYRIRCLPSLFGLQGEPEFTTFNFKRQWTIDYIFHTSSLR